MMTQADENGKITGFGITEKLVAFNTNDRKGVMLMVNQGNVTSGVRLTVEEAEQVALHLLSFVDTAKTQEAHNAPLA